MDVCSGKPVGVRCVSDQPTRDPVKSALPWVAAAVVVLALAVTAGFVVAYLVASGRAVDAPAALV